MRRVFFTLLLILIPACGGSDHSSPAPPLPLSPAPAAPSAAPSSPLSASPPVSQGAARCTNPAPRSPYLAFVTATSAMVGWRCGPVGTVKWGSGANLDESLQDNTGEDQHFALIPSLNPQAAYSYQVEVDGIPLGGPTRFTTAPPPGNNHFSFVAFADSGTGSPEQLQLARLLSAMSFSLAIIAGDLVYDSGADAEYDPHYFLPYSTLIDHIPFFPVPGNHDIVTDGGLPFRQNLFLPKGHFYYDFFWGDTHFIGLDSNQVTDPGQNSWLASVIGMSARWKIVYFHHPPFNSGAYGNDPAVRRSWVPLFARNQVDLVITGHAHDYERTVPQNGVTYVVTGGGGAPLYPVKESDFTAFSEEIHEILSVQITESQLTLQALDSAGNVIDQFTQTKPS